VTSFLGWSQEGVTWALDCLYIARNIERSAVNISTQWPDMGRYQRIRTVDAHTEGEPFRVVVDGFPELRGDTLLDYRRDAKERFDHLRKALMWEPRGHADMYGCLLTPPVSDTADFGILFTHNEGFSPMCGHGIIAIATVVLETGMISVERGIECEKMLRIDSPAGLITAYAHWNGQRVTRVHFHNVPSFVADLDAEVAVPGLGLVPYDLVFGGGFYAYVQAEAVGVGLDGRSLRALVDKGMRIKHAIMEQRQVVHPFEEDLSFLYGVIFVGPAHAPGHHSRNVCIFADGEVDRCPTGTGVSGRVALHYARGELKVGQPVVIESILGSCFTAAIHETTTFGPYDAVIARVEGRAFITGRHEFLIDPEDDLRHGFLLR